MGNSINEDSIDRFIATAARNNTNGGTVNINIGNRNIINYAKVEINEIKEYNDSYNRMTPEEQARDEDRRVEERQHMEILVVIKK